MCLEDYTIARQLRTRVYATDVALTIPSNPSRVALALSADPSEQASLSVNYQTQGLAVPPTTARLAISDASIAPIQPPIVLRLEEYGDVLKAELVLQPLLATGKAFLVETYLEIDTPYNPTLTKLPR